MNESQQAIDVLWRPALVSRRSDVIVPLAHALMQHDRYEDAVYVLGSIDHVDAYSTAVLSEAYAGFQDRESAINALETSLSKDPSSAYRWFKLGMFYCADGDAERALNAWSEAHRLDPTNPLYLDALSSQGCPNQ
jgi:tetratricopeptide (TPR) repeat protein